MTFTIDDWHLIKWMWVKKYVPKRLLKMFISRVSTLMRDIDIAILSVRLSVCPSVCDVPVSDKNGLIYRHQFFSPYDSPIILVLLVSNVFTKFRRGHPAGR